MKDQHTLITGYRDLSQHEIDAINAIKSMGETLGELVEKMRDDQSIDQRWVSIGATHMQQGFMALTRAIAQPETF